MIQYWIRTNHFFDHTHPIAAVAAIDAVAIDAVAAVVLTLQLSLLSNHRRSGLSLI